MSRDDLSKAIKEGKLKKVKYLIEEENAEIYEFHDYKYGYKFNALELAIQCKFLDIVQYLAENSYIDDYILSYAINWGNLDIVRYLVEKQDMFNSKNRDDVISKLICRTDVVGSDMIDMIKYFITDCDMNPDVREINRGTILHVFLKKNLFSHVKFLIEELGMDPNKTDNQGKDALFLAVERNHFETVQYLIHERKMDPNGKHRKDDSESILSLAVKHATDLHILKYLIEEHKMDKLEALREIWRCKNFNVFKEFNEYFNTKNEKIKDGNILHTSLTLPEVIFLVEECKIDPNETDDNGNNALHKAVILGHLDIIEYYFEKCKMDPNVKNKNGQNALHLSVLHLLTVNIKNNIRENYIVEYLISIGMDKNEKDSENCNILTIAAKNYYIDLIKMLIEKYNMNPNEPDSNGKFVLYHIIDQIKKNRHHRKATYSRFSLSEEDLHEEDDEEAYINLIYLIDKCKMDPNKKDSDGKNALHHAVGTWGFIEYLIDECKMNPNEKDNDGNNVLHITAYEGRDSLEKHLIRKYGMNPNEKNNIGDTVCSIRYGSC